MRAAAWLAIVPLIVSACDGGKGCFGPAEPTCGDTLTNAKQCGACDHDCGGTACAEGVCEAQVLATGIDFPSDIVVDETHAYVLGGQGLQRVAIAGGPLEAVGERTSVEGLAIDARDIWTFDQTDAALIAIPKTGGAPRQIAKTPKAYDLAVDDTDLYFGTGVGEDASILRVSKAGGDPVEIARGLDFVSDVLLDGDDVVFVEYEKKRIGRVPKRGGDVTFIGTSETTVHGLAVDGGDVAWLDIDIQLLERGAKSPRLLGHASGEDLEARGGFVYWGDGYPGGGVHRVTMKGARVTKLAASPHRIEALATDDRYVYWAERGEQSKSGALQTLSGRILRVGR